MRRAWIAREMAALVLMASCAVPARAQQTQPQAPGASGSPPSSGEVGLMYSAMRLQEATAKSGFGVDVSRTIGHSANDVALQVVGDLSFNHFYGATSETEAANQTSVMGGLRMSGRTRSGATPFAQVLAGIAHCCGETSPAVSFGGGISVPFSGNRFSFRVQADFPVIFYTSGVDDTGAAYGAYHDTGARINVGIAIPIRR